MLTANPPYLRNTFAAFCLSLLCALAVPLAATTVMQMDLDENVARSEYVVLCRVGDQSHDWIETGGNRFFVTLTTIEVQHTWIGPRSVDELTVVTPGGGSPDGGETFIPVPAGFPEFTPGDELMLVLEPATRGVHVLPALHQSKYFVEKASDDGIRDGDPPLRFRRAAGSARVVTRDGGAAPSLFEKTEYDLDELEEALAKSAAEHGKTFRALERDEATEEEQADSEQEDRP